MRPIHVVAIIAGIVLISIGVGIQEGATFEPKGATSFQTEAAMWLQECEPRCPKGTKPFILQGGAAVETHEDWRCGCMRK